MLEKGDLDNAIKLAREISDKHYFWVVAEVVEELAKRGEFKKAIELADEILTTYDYAEAISKIVKELTKRGRIEEALDLAEKAYPEQTREIWKPYILAGIPEALIELGKHEEAKHYSDRVIDEIKANITSHIDFEQIPFILKRIGRLDELDNIVEHAIKRLAKSLDDEKRAIEAYLVMNSAIDSLKYLKEFDRAIKLVERVRLPSRKDQLLCSICHDLVNEDIEKAIEVVEKIEYPRDRSCCLISVVWKLAEVDPERALEIAENIEDEDVLYDALWAIVDALLYDKKAKCGESECCSSEV